MKDSQVFRIAATGRKRNIDGVAFAGVNADLVDCPRPGIVRKLMRRNEKHVRIVVKSLLGAVTVVNVPVHDQNSLRPVFPFQIVRADGDRIEQAEAHRAISQGVMTRRSHQSEAVAAFTGRERIEQSEEAAHRQQSDAERITASHRVTVERISVSL
jgi:hypothetical protein